MADSLQIYRLQRVIEMNNHGCEMIVDSSLRSSGMDILSEALGLSRDSLFTHDIEGRLSSRNDNPEECGNSSASWTVQIFPITRSRILIRSKETGAAGALEDCSIVSSDTFETRCEYKHCGKSLLSTVAAFNRPMLFKFTLVDSDQNVLSSLASESDILMPCSRILNLQTILSSVLIFNLALANHLNEIENLTRHQVTPMESVSFQATSRKNLGRAVQLYGFSLTLPQTNDAASEEVCALMQLASLNNLAQAHLLLGDNEKSQDCLQRLLSLLLLFVDTHQNDSDQKTRESMEGFWTNVFHLIFSSAPSPAAAA